MQRAFLIVLDSVGIGAAPDAAVYGDNGANTLAHLAHAVDGLNAPVLQRMGLGNIPAIIPNGEPIKGVPPTPTPIASFGAMQAVSQGKDTTTGHWEIAGLVLNKAFQCFPAQPPSFPAELISALETRTGRKVIGNKAASGTAIIDELGPQQLQSGAWIVYTSADSVLQIAAHIDTIPLEDLYSACEIARKLSNPHRIGRVIARPYKGSPGHFIRTAERRDFSYPLPEPTILDQLSNAGIPVTTVGKLDDIFDGQGITTSYHCENNTDAATCTLQLATEQKNGLIFVNLIDFDMLYGHRRNPAGYANALETADHFLDKLTEQLQNDDLLIITADHGNDPTFRGTDHCREFVPLLVYHASMNGVSLGIRKGFFDVAQSLATWFDIAPVLRGKSFVLPPRIRNNESAL